jgi:hypothetical protein
MMTTLYVSATGVATRIKNEKRLDKEPDRIRSPNLKP